MKHLNGTEAWQKLTKHYQEMKNEHLRDLFRLDPYRFDKFSIKWEDFLLDFSKNIINYNTLLLLTELANERNLLGMIKSMFAGDKINTTEKRAVLHIALRNSSINQIKVDGWDIMPQVEMVLNQMKNFVDAIHRGEKRGCTGMPITDIVNIGIGGSDLGPMMVCNALKKYSKPGMSVHFISNIDGTQISEVLKRLNPATTLFIIASKTFTTQETLVNANTAKRWFLQGIAKHQEDVSKHFVAISTNEDAVKQFGINPENMFGFWSWVGGRYSLWSAIGLSIALYLGMDKFEELLEGAHEMDQHFLNTPFESNIPVILALMGVWYTDFFNTKTHAIIPYDQYLEFFPDYLQQLDMESNGKSVTKEGVEVSYPTGPVIWGKPGTNAQHSFFQLIHQGTQMIPADFIAPVESLHKVGEHHDILISNFLAQTEALMKGKTEVEAKEELLESGIDNRLIKDLLPHKVFRGNKPTNTIFFKKLTPKNLGSLIAMYEHKVFVQGVIWGINSFDQWGVELGKQLANKILPELRNEEKISTHDVSTNNLINYYKNIKLSQSEQIS